MSTAPILIAGSWREATADRTFRAVDPSTRQPFGDAFPESGWADLDIALTAGRDAFERMRAVPAEGRSAFLRAYADRIDANAVELAAIAQRETALSAQARFVANELPRTTLQLREAARAADDGSWALPTIDRPNHIRSCLNAIGPVIVMGPANFPFAYNAVAGGDFAGAIAAGCPVIAKGHPAQPHTTRRLAELAYEAARSTGLPPGAIQLIYHCPADVGLRAVEDSRCAAIAFTGSRPAGMALRDAAHRGGKPAFLEMSSINPVVLLPGALDERPDEVVDQFVAASQLAVGQMCTNPGLVLLLEGAASERFVEPVAERFRQTRVGTLLTEGIEAALARNVRSLIDAGATLVVGGRPASHGGFGFEPTLLRVRADAFLASPSTFQTELFGPACLIVTSRDLAELSAVLRSLEGNLCGSIYSARSGSDNAAIQAIAPLLREKVGRLLNDKMPPGVTVSPAMNHGGPFPATASAAFTAVGFPASMRRFGKLDCYERVRDDRLPAVLRDANPTGAWRLVDGSWSREAIA